MAEPVVARSRYSQVRCLLIEDSQFDQRRIKRILDQLGIGKLDIASTVDSARLHLVRNRVDLILLDNGLPDGSGVDFALELSERPSLANIPVVIVSDWPTPFMFDKALAARVQQVLSKDEFNLARAVDVLNSSRSLATKTSHKS